MRFMAAFPKLWYFLTFMANIAVKNLQIAIFIWLEVIAWNHLCKCFCFYFFVFTIYFEFNYSIIYNISKVVNVFQR